MPSPAAELRLRLSQALESLDNPAVRVRFPSSHKFVTGLEGAHFHLRAELFVQCQAGTRFHFPGEDLDLGPDEILVVPAKVLHAETILPAAQPFRNVVLYADEDALSCHLADKGPNGRPRIAYPESLVGPACGRIAGWLEDAALTHHEFEDPELVRGLAKSILGLTLRLLDHPASKHDDEPLPIVRCRRMVHEDLGNPELSVATLAARLGCSADYLSHLFRTVRGEKLTAYIEELRMLRAAELLNHGGLSCKEVAWASGYANQSYFIRRFRERWGTSPGQWPPNRP